MRRRLSSEDRVRVAKFYHQWVEPGYVTIEILLKRFAITRTTLDRILASNTER